MSIKREGRVPPSTASFCTELHPIVSTSTPIHYSTQIAIKSITPLVFSASVHTPLITFRTNQVEEAWAHFLHKPSPRQTTRHNFVNSSLIATKEEMGRDQKTCPKHGTSCRRATAEKKSRPEKGLPSNRNEKRTSDSKNMPRNEESTISNPMSPTRRHLSGKSQTGKHEQKNCSNVRSPRRRSSLEKISAANQSSSLNPSQTPTQERNIRHTNICPKHGTSCVRASSKKNASKLVKNAENKHKARRHSRDRSEAEKDKRTKCSHGHELRRARSSGKSSTPRASSNYQHRKHSSPRKDGSGPSSSEHATGKRSSSRKSSCGNSHRIEESKRPRFSGDKTTGRHQYETITKKLPNPLQEEKDYHQPQKFITFYASDTIDLARRERRRKRATNASGMVRSKSFVYVKHPKAPGAVISASERLDAFDKYLLRVKVNEEGKFKISDVPRWLNNDTQESLRELAKLYLNKIRTNRRLRQVSLDRHLNKVTGNHNHDQAYVLRLDKTSHIGSDGKDFKGRLKQIRYKAQYSYELLARGPESVSEVLEYFMGHSRYRSILLYHRLSVMGIHGGRDILGNWFWTLALCG